VNRDSIVKGKPLERFLSYSLSRRKLGVFNGMKLLLQHTMQHAKLEASVTKTQEINKMFMKSMKIECKIWTVVDAEDDGLMPDFR
jgi:hypothetical protein